MIVADFQVLGRLFLGCFRPSVFLYGCSYRGPFLAAPPLWCRNLFCGARVSNPPPRTNRTQMGSPRCPACTQSRTRIRHQAKRSFTVLKEKKILWWQIYSNLLLNLCTCLH